jgi:hypothetical protein
MEEKTILSICNVKYTFSRTGIIRKDTSKIYVANFLGVVFTFQTEKPQADDMSGLTISEKLKAPEL